MSNTTLTAIDGLLAGHSTDDRNHTGCTAILCPQGFTPGIAVPGFAPGCRETELMRPESQVDTVHGLLLAGGSAFGLAAADGVMRFLREQGHGFAMPHGVIPIVPGAVIYDLDMNARPGVLPDADMGYAAARAASAAPLAEGAVGAACGARCGRLFCLCQDAAGKPLDLSDKSGLGSLCLEREGIRVAALVVLNALGNVYDARGNFLAGGRFPDGTPVPHAQALDALAGQVPAGNTVLTVVATNVPLDKTQCSRLARMAATGLAGISSPRTCSSTGISCSRWPASSPCPKGTAPGMSSCWGPWPLTPWPGPSAVPPGRGCSRDAPSQGEPCRTKSPPSLLSAFFRHAPLNNCGGRSSGPRSGAYRPAVSVPSPTAGNTPSIVSKPPAMRVVFHFASCRPTS